MIGPVPLTRTVPATAPWPLRATWTYPQAVAVLGSCGRSTPSVLRGSATSHHCRARSIGVGGRFTCLMTRNASSLLKSSDV